MDFAVSDTGHHCSVLFIHEYALLSASPFDSITVQILTLLSSEESGIDEQDQFTECSQHSYAQTVSDYFQHYSGDFERR
ncbi:MAG: hypothetical protein K5705_00015 [Oscillospiraceae bacterium]|nr:hypothetical protein [Oscillospiraceae bacterium]